MSNKYDLMPFEILHDDALLYKEAYELLRQQLEKWNNIAIDNGAAVPPYKDKVDRVKVIIGFYKENISLPQHYISDKVSEDTLRLNKAALLFAAHQHNKKIEQSSSGWPQAVLDTAKEKPKKFETLAGAIKCEPDNILLEILPNPNRIKPEPNISSNRKWDAFISHASEDKKDFAAPLAAALDKQGLNIWYDEMSLTVGDSLRRSIDNGLSNSKFGIVILSPSFFKKEWPQKELAGLFTKERNGQKVLLPVWHNVSISDIENFSPMLADRVAVSSNKGLPYVVGQLIGAIKNK